MRDSISPFYICGKTFKSSIVISTKAPEALFNFVTAPANWRGMHPQTVRVESDGELDLTKPIKGGDRFKETTKAGPLHQNWDWECTESAPYSRFQFAGKATGLEATITYNLTKQDESEYCFEREFELKATSIKNCLILPVASLIIKRSGSKYLQKVKEWATACPTP